MHFIDLQFEEKVIIEIEKMASVDRHGDDDIKKRLNKTFENRLDLDRVGICIRISIGPHFSLDVANGIGNTGRTLRSVDLLHREHIVGETEFTQPNRTEEPGDQREFPVGIQGGEKIVGRNL